MSSTNPNAEASFPRSTIFIALGCALITLVSWGSIVLYRRNSAQRRLEMHAAHLEELDGLQRIAPWHNNMVKHKEPDALREYHFVNAADDGAKEWSDLLPFAATVYNPKGLEGKKNRISSSQQASSTLTHMDVSVFITLPSPVKEQDLPPCSIGMAHVPCEWLNNNPAVK